jgi:hypothetical protein
MKQMAIALLLAVTLVAMPACGQTTSPPPNLSMLSTEGRIAYEATRVIVALDVIRDIAVDASNTAPPLLPHATMLRIVAWHKAAITTAHESATGWRAAIRSTMQAAQAALTPAEHAQLDPYFTLAQTLLTEVTP